MIELLVGTGPLSDVVVDLAQPSFKHDIAIRMADTSTGEGVIRRAAHREFALAARDDGDALRENKLRDAIKRAGRQE